MTDNERRRIRNNAIVAFVQLAGASVVIHDESRAWNVSTDEFLETLDRLLSVRLGRPDGAELAQPIEVLCDIFRTSVRRTKNRLVMGRTIEELFDELDIDFD